MKEYYKAYDDRYRAMHRRGLRWASDEPTLLVVELIKKHGFASAAKMLEIGCGEGRDAGAVLNQGYDLTAADVSPEAIRYCRERYPAFADSFIVLDCLSDSYEGLYDYIYSVAVIHMLISEDDRQRFYRFIRDHLTEKGIALICSMGDGQTESCSDIHAAYEPVPRDHPAGEVTVPQTSCRIVSLSAFEAEILSSGLFPEEIGITSSPPEFDKMLYAVVRASADAL